MPRVSIIIASYNCERFIRQTIAGIFAQTYQDFELIVVDDGSTDGTREIVASYGPPVRLIPQTNARVCAARNRGIREAKGEFICLLDHDDYWFPHKLERQLWEFERRAELGVVYSTFILWNADSNGRFPGPASYDLGAYSDGADPKFSGWIYHQFLLDCWMLTSTAMFRAQVFERCGGFDESLAYSEDWDLWLRIAQEFQFLQLRRPTTLYRQHSNQGNRVIRDRDYRTHLLLRAVRQWGFCSRDGRCISPVLFRRQLAMYHAEFGFSHVKNGSRRTGLAALAKAWWTYPFGVKYLSYMAAVLAGWRPSW